MDVFIPPGGRDELSVLTTTDPASGRPTYTLHDIRESVLGHVFELEGGVFITVPEADVEGPPPMRSLYEALDWLYTDGLIGWQE